jgi:hypothetical protein
MNRFVMVINSVTGRFAVADCAGGQLLPLRSMPDTLRALAALNAADGDPDKVSPEIFPGWTPANKFWHAFQPADDYRFDSALARAQFKSPR